MKKTIKKILANFGLELKKINPNKIYISKNKTFTMRSALIRCAERGIDINTVIDVGASDGRWSQLCLKTYPNANYLLVEAQKGHVNNLNEFCNTHKNVAYVLAAAGPKDGTVYFNDEALFGGQASTDQLKGKQIEVKAISIDNEVKRRDLKPPYLLKLDTHGFEVPIIEGAKDVIIGAELVIIETYNYQLTNDSLKFYEMCDYMKRLGFYPIEIVDLMLREYDNTFWQMDTFFVKSADKSFSYTSYK
jgi:FkbM family methyltransferase